MPLVKKRYTILRLPFFSIVCARYLVHDTSCVPDKVRCSMYIKWPNGSIEFPGWGTANFSTDTDIPTTLINRSCVKVCTVASMSSHAAV